MSFRSAVYFPTNKLPFTNSWEKGFDIMAFMDSLKKFVFAPATDDEAEEEAVTPTPKAEKKEKRSYAQSSYSEDFSAPGVRKAKVVNLASASAQRIVVVKLDSYTGAKAVINHLKEKTPVVFNIARLDRAEAVRAVDAVYGASYALDGSMQKVSNDIFIVTPYGTEITGDITEQIIGSNDFSLDV